MFETVSQQLWRWVDAPLDVRLACEIAPDYVAAVRHHQGRIEAWAVRPLPADAVRPSPLADNIPKGDAVREALEHVLGAVADGHRRCALIVPDLVARVALLEFDRLPNRREEAEGLVRWRLSKDLPFDLQQAVLSFQTQPGRNAGQEVLAAVCLRQVVRQYESCVEPLGLQPGQVTLSTLAALGCLSSGAEPRLLVKRDQGSLGLAIADGDAVRLFRSLPLPHGNGTRGDEALLEKVYPALVYFQDQWGQGVKEVVLAGAARAEPAFVERLQQEAGSAVTELDVAAFDLPPSPVSGAQADARLIPVIGATREKTV